ncbi:MAG: hypothetical protein ACLSHR_11535 [Oscillospiraceae bacterium]
MEETRVWQRRRLSLKVNTKEAVLYSAKSGLQKSNPLAWQTFPPVFKENPQKNKYL